MSSMTRGDLDGGGTNLRCLDFNCFPRLSRVSVEGIGGASGVGGKLARRIE